MLCLIECVVRYICSTGQVKLHFIELVRPEGMIV